MQSFLHDALLHDSGYFHVWISSSSNAPFFQTSPDKAFFIGLIQDGLSPRTKLAEQHIVHYSYGTDIDLLAYSLTNSGVHLLVHTSRKSAIEALGQYLLLSYENYLQTQSRILALPFETIFIFDKLAGRHEALQVSKEIHLLHEDWRGDRYSSIGFYVDDRRGDWMRPYRLTSLFDNKPRKYLAFLKSRETASDRLFEYLET
jgi:hypothetical protein